MTPQQPITGTPVAGESQAQADARARALADLARQQEIAKKIPYGIGSPAPGVIPEVPPAGEIPVPKEVEVKPAVETELIEPVQPPKVDLSRAKPDYPGANYTTINGQRYYLPGTTPYQQGFRTVGQWQEMSAGRGGATVGPNVAVKDSRGNWVQITRAEAIALDRLKQSDPESYANQLIIMGLIPDTTETEKQQQIINRAMFEQRKVASKLAQLRDTNPEEYINELVRQGYLIPGSQYAGGTGENITYTTPGQRWAEQIAGKEALRKRKTIQQSALATQVAVESALQQTSDEGIEPTWQYGDKQITEAERQDILTEWDIKHKALLARGITGIDAINEIGQNPRDTMTRLKPVKVISDIGREALSFGAVETPTFNRVSVGNQYQQQKEVALATFLGDTNKLSDLHDKGYFGKGADGDQAYQDALKTIQQQDDIKAAVEAGDTLKLRELWNEGAFGDDGAAYTNLTNYVANGGRELAPITADDVKAVDEAFGTKKEYVDNVMQSMPSLAGLSKDVAIGLVPIWGTIYYWDKLGTTGKAVSIAADAASLIPIVAGVSAVAKTAAGVGRTARIAASLKAVPKLAYAELMSPITALAHPIETVKAISGTARGLINVLNPKHIPGSTLSTVYSTVRLDTSILGDSEATKYVRDQLMLKQARGERPVVQFGDKVFTLRSGTFLSEGGVAHASPNIRFTGEPEGFAITTKVYPEGHSKAGQPMPTSEQGLFVANVALERFTTSSAFGFEGTAGQADKLKTLSEAVQQANNVGDIKKAGQLQKLLDDYNNALAGKDIKGVNKAEFRISSKLSELAQDEIINKINNARRIANERYMIGDIEGAQEAMQEAMAYEKQLQRARPGFAIFSPDVARIAVPTGKTYTGMIFQPSMGEIWSISLNEMKRDRAAKLLQEAADAEKLGDKATAGKLTKEAHDMMIGGKTGFRRVSTTEMELKFPELTQIQQLKPRYTTTSEMGSKLWIYTDKPYNPIRVLKSKLMAPIDTIRNIYEPAIKVRTIPMTRAQKISRIEELLAEAADAEKAGELEKAAILRAEAKIMENSLKSVIKGVDKSADINEAIARSERMDRADELLQESKRAEMYGDFANADRLAREAERIAGRRYVMAILRRAGTISGLTEYLRALSISREIERKAIERGITTPTRIGRIPSRIERLETTRITTGREAEMPRMEISRADELREIQRLQEAGRTIEPSRLEEVSREGRIPEILRESREVRTPEIPRAERITQIPDQPRLSREIRQPRIPREGRVIREIRQMEKEGRPILPSYEKGKREIQLPEGSVTWRQGIFWKWIPREDFVDGIKPRTLPKGTSPIGAKTVGRTPAETIQIIGGGSVPNFSVDLGKVDLRITNQAQNITFSGSGEQTDVGDRIIGTTTGMTVNNNIKGHAYARKKYPAHSISRTAITEETEEPVRGVSEIREYRPGIIEEESMPYEDEWPYGTFPDEGGNNKKGKKLKNIKGKNRYKIKKQKRDDFSDLTSLRGIRW